MNARAPLLVACAAGALAGCSGDGVIHGYFEGRRGQLLFSHEHPVLLEGMELTVSLPDRIVERRGGGRGSLTPGRTVVLFEADFDGAEVEVTAGEEISVVSVGRTAPSAGEQPSSGLQVRLRCARLTPRPAELRVRVIDGERTRYDDHVHLECWKIASFRFFTSPEDVRPEAPEGFPTIREVRVGAEFEVPFELTTLVGGGHEADGFTVPEGSPLELRGTDVGPFGRVMKLRAIAPGRDPVVRAGAAEAVLPIEISPR